MALLDAQADDGIEYARPVQVRRQPARMRKAGRLAHILERQHASPHRILKRQQPRRRKMHILRLDGPGDALKGDGPIRFILERLRLDAAEHRGAALLVLIGMGLLAHEILIAAPAMRHQRSKIALRAGRKKERTFKTESGRDLRLQSIDGRIIAIYVIADLGAGEGPVDVFNLKGAP